MATRAGISAIGARSMARTVGGDCGGSDMHSISLNASLGDALYRTAVAATADRHGDFSVQPQKGHRTYRRLGTVILRDAIMMMSISESTAAFESDPGRPAGGPEA